MSVLSLIPEDKRRDFIRKESAENVYSSSSRLNLLQKRKRFNPLTVEMSSQSLSSRAGDRFVTQRVLSAKTHRVKQLQNQLADAHYHLQELSNENRVLRALQKKQDIALQRYENSNAELPQVLNSHTEEIRIQQAKFKQLKQQFKDVTQRLKERDMQLQQLKDEHQHLLDLSKDRNLPEREKLQSQVTELTARVQQQQETISMLQRRLVLEAKNFKHQLQVEINKHKDTRNDLDLAINNADKLSTIIEMKEKMLSTAASRHIKSPVKISLYNSTKPNNRGMKFTHDESGNRSDEDRTLIDQDAIGKLCENSRSLSSALSRDEEISSSVEPRSRFVRSRTNSTSTRSTRKSSKGSDDIIELAKTVQDGMADLSIFDQDIDLKSSSPDEVQKKIEVMKAELLKKIKNNEDPLSIKEKPDLIRKSTEDSIEEHIDISDESDRPKSRGRRGSSVSFQEETIIEQFQTTSTKSFKIGNENEIRLKRENSVLERKSSGTNVEKLCKDVIHDIEKSSRVIDRHLQDYNSSKFDSDKLVQQLHAVDKINEFVNSRGEVPEETLVELNNNFKLLTSQVVEPVPMARKRSISGRRNSRPESKTNLFGDSSLSNRDLLEDLLGKK